VLVSVSIRLICSYQLIRYGKVKAISAQTCRQIGPRTKIAHHSQFKKPTGFVYTQVEKNSPADKGGLLSGDIIYAFNDQAVETSDQLFKLLTKIGRSVSIHQRFAEQQKKD